MGEWRQLTGLVDHSEYTEGDGFQFNRAEERLWNIRIWWQWLRKTSKPIIGTAWNDLRSVSDHPP